MKRSPCGFLIALALLALTITAPARAQSQADRFGRTLEQIERESRLLVDPDVPLDQRALIDYGGYSSFFFSTITDSQGGTHTLRLTDINAYLRVNVDGAHQVFVRGRGSYWDWDDHDSFDGKGDEWRGPVIERAVYRLDLQRALAGSSGEMPDFNVIFQGGRQLVHWGNGLVLSRVIDGGVIDGDYAGLRLEALGGRTFRDQVDIDSSRPGFTERTHRFFYGGMLSYELKGHRPYVYGLVQEDDNDQSAGPPGPHFSWGYDSYYVGGGIRGPIGDKLVYGVEAAYEGGESRSNPLTSTGALGQTQEQIHAWAVDARLDYMFGDAHNTRVSGQALFASGDDSRVNNTTNMIGGNVPGTDDESFNAFGLINTGLAFAPNVSNLLMLRAGASTFPLEKVDLFRRLQIGVDGFVYFRMDDDAPVDEPTDGAGSYLGTEGDVYANWQVTSDVAVLVRYGIFFPGSDLTFNNEHRQFLFTGVTLAF